MKTIEQIKKEMAEIVKFHAENPEAKGKASDRTRMEMLRKCMYYLETNPNEDFVKQMLADTKKRLRQIADGFSAWLNVNSNDKFPLKHWQQKYNTECDTKSHKQYERALKYILND